MQTGNPKSKSRVVIGDYQMIRLLGEGTTAKVFLAEHNRTRTPIAIKRISIKFINENASNREYFLNELQIMNKLKHPNLLHCYELYQTTSNFYILMEYCDGGSLKHLRGNKGGLSEVESLVYMRQIMEGFKALRRHKIIHRDVKLENMLLKDGLLKIADFGTAKRGMESTSTKMIGTFLTMAPEVMQVFNTDDDEETYSSKVDLWSIGVVFYEILFGESPFYGSYVAKMIQSMKNDSGDNLKILKPVSPDVEALLKGLLRFDPKQRISWEDFFKHAAFGLHPLPAHMEKVYTDYKYSQFEKGNRLRKRSTRRGKRQPQKKMAKSASKTGPPRESPQAMKPKPMHTIENFSALYKSRDKSKKSSKNSSKKFKTSILNESSNTKNTAPSKSSEQHARFSSTKLSKVSTRKSNYSNNDKSSQTSSINRVRSHSDQAPGLRNQLIFSKVSNQAAKPGRQYGLQHSETLPIQRHSMSTQGTRGKKKFSSHIKNHVPRTGGDSARRLKPKTGKSKSRKNLSKSSNSRGQLALEGSRFQSKSRSTVKSKKRIKRSTESQIRSKKRKLLKKYKLEFQMRLISNRYFHEKNKILFINITLKNIRDLINRGCFAEVESHLYVCVIYLMQKAVFLSESILSSLRRKQNIFRIDFFGEYTESKNHLEMIREYLDDWTSCKNYFSIFVERIRSKSLPFAAQLEEHIGFLSKKNHVTPANLRQILKTQFAILTSHRPLDKVGLASQSPPQAKLAFEDKTSSRANAGEPKRKKRKQLETDFYRMLVQLKYSIFTDESFPYVINNNFFDWKAFFAKFQSYKKERLKRIIKMKQK